MPIRPFEIPADIQVMVEVIPPSFQYPENDAWSMQDDEAQAMIDSFNGIKSLWPVIRVIQVFVPPMRDIMRGYIWEEDDQVVGLSNVLRSGNTDQWLIGNVSVLPEYRRRGIARQLVAACADYACERGASQITLEVIEQNVPAVTLYESLGFEVFGGESQLEIEPSDAVEDVPLSPDYVIKPVGLFNWKPSFELAQRVVPETVKKYRPVEPGRFKQPQILRPLLPLLFRAMGSRPHVFEVRRRADDLLVARIGANVRLRSGGINSINITLDPAHGAIAPALIAFMLRTARQHAPGRRIELTVPAWQRATLDAAFQAGFTTRCDMVSMGIIT